VDNGMPNSQGIYVFKSDPKDGSLTQVQVMMASNPSYLALDSTGKFLYADNEDGTGMYAMDMKGGNVSAYSIGADGTLANLNSLPSKGDWPTHIRVHPMNQFVYAANYGTGNWPVYQIKADGSLAMMTDAAQDTGDGTGADSMANGGRQGGPHAHQMLADSSGKHVFGVDLGADRISIFNLDPTTGKFTPNEVPYAGMPSDTGPRHMVFDQTEQHAYVLSEFTSDVFVFDYDSTRGALAFKQAATGLPSTSDPSKNHGAEIRMHPSGKFLYTTIRGDNTVGMFSVDPNTGELKNIGWQPTMGDPEMRTGNSGDWPRGMNIDPEGMYLYVGNENSDFVTVFAIGQTSGKLTFSTKVHTPVPVDIEFGQKL
jgi:6-phosphogluconolactonase